MISIINSLYQGDHWAEQFHNLFKEEQIYNFCASGSLKPII